MTLKRNIRRVLLLGGLTLLLVVGLVILFFGRTASSPLPNPNGYTDLLQAGKPSAAIWTALLSADRDGLRALVATNAEALRLLRVGLSRECSAPTDAIIANCGTSPAT